MPVVCVLWHSSDTMCIRWNGHGKMVIVFIKDCNLEKSLVNQWGNKALKFSLIVFDEDVLLL